MTNTIQLINSSLILKSADGTTGMTLGNKNSIGNRQEITIESRNYQKRPSRNALNNPCVPPIKPDSRISPAILPEGYNGKILLISVSGDGIKNAVLLRSGDLWHREILHNAAVEIKNLGFENALVHQLGGAHVRFEPDGTIIIYGASQEFGACDKQYAAELVRDLFPERRVEIRT